MAEEGPWLSGLSSGLAVLLAKDDARANKSSKSRLISCHDDIGHQSVERMLEHVFDLPRKSVDKPSGVIDVNFVRALLRNQERKFGRHVASHDRDGLLITDCGSGVNNVVIDESSICGDIKTVFEPLLVESHAPFSSARTNACIWSGKWMYEVTLDTSGVQQLGWVLLSCPFTDCKGVGDSDDSYAYDGRRETKWNKDPKAYGQLWTSGDVIGCCIDLDAGEVSFYRNGIFLGLAFDGIRKVSPNNGYYPAISLSDGERCYLNFGSHPFRYPIDGFNALQAPRCSKTFANYLLQSLSRLMDVQSLSWLMDVQSLEKSESACFEKLSRVKRFAPLKELFHPLSQGICAELFNLIEECHGHCEYLAWGCLQSFLLEIFRLQEPHDFDSVDRVIDLFLQYPGSTSLFEKLIMALAYSCKVAPLVLVECPYSGSYPYLALACHLFIRREMMVLWWKSGHFMLSFEGFLSRKIPNKQDLVSLIPSVWWPGSSVESESSLMLTTTALSGAFSKIEAMLCRLCSLVINFLPPELPSSLPGSVFRTFVQNLILKARGNEHRMVASGTSNNSVLVSVYTVILHHLSEGFTAEDASGSAKCSGFLHKGGRRRFPVKMFLKSDPFYCGIPRIGGSINNLITSHQISDFEADEVQWDEGCMSEENSRVTHFSTQKPCCCSSPDASIGQTSKENLRYIPAKSKSSSKEMAERSRRAPADCSASHLSEDIDHKPSSSNQSDTEFDYQSLTCPDSLLLTSQSSTQALGEEELLELLLLLYHLGAAPSFREAFFYISQQSQSISLLEDTDKQILEKPGSEQVKRLREARSVYHEELVSCVRQCIWYRVALFSHWKQRGMYATCIWIAELLLVLSDAGTPFLYTPEFYMESLVDCFHALRRSDPPFVPSTVFIKQGLSSFVSIVVKHFNDPRILSADLKDALLQSILVLVQNRDFFLALESNKEVVQRMPRALLSAFDNRSWIPVTNILVRLCKGSGFAAKNADYVPSAIFQVQLRETCIHDQELFSSFLNQLFNTLSWTMTEFSMSVREMHDKHQLPEQLRKCTAIFDISCSLARILEFCTRETPDAFLLGPDMNLRRLTELVVFILNHMISAADSDFFDVSLRRPGQQEKTSRTMILAPLAGIILNLIECSSVAGHRELGDVIAVFASMYCPATIHIGVEYLLSYNWSNVLSGDAALAKLAQLEEFSRYFRSITETGEGEASVCSSDDEEDGCCICYSRTADAMFEPCHHKSCIGCITRHLLNSHRCFFCNATVTSITRPEQCLGVP